MPPKRRAEAKSKSRTPSASRTRRTETKAVAVKDTEQQQKEEVVVRAEPITATTTTAKDEVKDITVAKAAATQPESSNVTPPPPPIAAVTHTPLVDRATELQDELIWSEDGISDGEHSAEHSDTTGEDKAEVILFPGAEELRNNDDNNNNNENENNSAIVRLGTTQQLDESDSSEDEAVLNRVGDIPLEWYKDEDHIGYDIEGKKLLKSERSALERLLEATDDPNAMRTIHDVLHDTKKVLTNADLQILFNLQRNRTTNAKYDMYAEVQQDTVAFDPLNHPFARGTGPSRRQFQPSLHDMKVVAKMVRRLRRERALAKEKPEQDKESDVPQVIWDDAHVEMDTHTHYKYHNRVPKPKVLPPGTYESYRPPPEYLPSEKAKQRQARLRAIDRKEHFLPQAFDALRHVPFYYHTIQDRYQRCLDLAFFPRAQRTRLVVDPAQLLPDLPDPRDLRPYPERLSFQYKGHTATVRSISVSPNGQYLATACDDHLVRVYETLTGRLMKRYDLGGPVVQVEFCPNRALNLLAAAVEYAVVFLVPTFAAHSTVNDHTVRFLRAPGLAAGTLREAHGEGDEGYEGTDGPLTVGAAETLHGRGLTQAVLDQDETAHEPAADLHDVEEREKRAEFIDATASERRAGIVVKVVMHAKVKRLTFHARGDYMCVLCPKDHVKYRQTIMLQLSRRKVFCPFRKFSEIVIDCKFHPREPIFFLATTNSVRCYNLLAHKLQRRYKAPGGVTTCLSIHPEGDNFLVGDTTSHTSWYDCDFSDKPYKRMRSHKDVVNAVAFHPNTNAYPLFASGAADGQVHVFHGMVYDDYNKNALIVPVKILKHRRPVYNIAWHPTLPWLFTCTEDGIVTAWTE